MESLRASFLFSERDPPAKKAILINALQLFVVNGFDATTIRAVGEAAGFTNPALFRHFESKEALALHLFEICYRHLAVRTAGDTASDFRSSLKDFVLRYLRAFEEYPEAVLFVQDHQRRFWPQMPVEVKNLSLFTRLQKIVEAGHAEGAVDSGIDARIGASAVLGALARTGRMFYFGETAVPAGSISPQLVRLIINMFGTLPN